MRKIYQLAAMLLAISLASCNNNSSVVDEVITVDVTASYPEKEFVLQDLFDVEYVPLETTDEFVTMGYMQDINKDMIIVRNINMNSDGDIFFFDRKGKGIRKINRQGPGPEEYQYLLHVTIDSNKNELFVVDRTSKKIKVYDLFGNYKRDFGYVDDARYNNAYHFDENYLLCKDYSSDFTDEKKDIFIIVSKQDGKKIKKIHIPYEDKISPVVRGNGMLAGPRNKQLVPYNNSWFLVEHSSDTIYQCHSDLSLTPFITRTPSIHAMDKPKFLFTGLLTDDYYFMQKVGLDYDFNKDNEDFPRTDLVYDKGEKAMYQAHVYNADDTEQENISLSHGLMVINRDGIAFVKTLEAIDLVEANERGKLQGELKNIADKLKEDDNPVLLIAKYKK